MRLMLEGPLEMVGSVLLFYKWGNQGTEKEDLPKVTELVTAELVLELSSLHSFL